MIALRVFVISALVLSTAQLSHGWKDQFVDILKNLVSAFPIPYASNIDMICGGQDAQLWFGASGTLDKDEDVLNGVDPSLNNIELSINVTNFKIPVKGRYTCKISFQTYSFNNLLLNLTGSSFDVTELINNDFIKKVYSSLFKGAQGGITYSTNWKLDSLAAKSTNPISHSKEEYGMRTLYPIINELIQVLLHLPRSVMTKLVHFGSLKETMFGSRKPIKHNKQGRDFKVKRIDNIDKEDATPNYFKRARQGTTERLDATNRNTFYGDNSRHGRIDKQLNIAGLSKNIREEKQNLDKTESRREDIAAIVAVSLLSLGIVVFISNAIIGLVVYHKYIRVRKDPQYVEAGLRKTASNIIRHARKGPTGVRLTAARVPSRINSAPVTSHVPTTPKINKTLVKPQEHVIIEPERINILKRSASELVNGQSLTEPSPDNPCYVQMPEPSSKVSHMHSLSQNTPSSSGENHPSFSHVCPGKHLYTMRKVSTATQLPRDNKDLNNQLKIIHVKPINTL